MQPTIPAGYRLELSDTADEATQALVVKRLHAFNDAASVSFQQKRVDGPRTLDVYLYTADGALVGGLLGVTLWTWLYVGDLWLAEPLRRQGLGRQMLARAEAAARVRGCTAAQLETYSFQARGFYEKQGYHVVGEMRDEPPGESHYWMRKDFGDGA